ncbi:MAG: hypothetical protein SFU87_06665 [Chitinophagaceae bacterium]|nr:hypothetical protein [Chitinophagaceae bacterium]
MDTDISSIVVNNVNAIQEEMFPSSAHNGKQEFQEPVFPCKRRFGIVDMWNIRAKKRNLSIYRTGT